MIDPVITIGGILLMTCGIFLLVVGMAGIALIDHLGSIPGRLWRREFRGPRDPFK